VGPIVIGMLPLLACAVAIFFVTRYLGGQLVTQMGEQSVAESLPTTLAAFWQLLRDQVTLLEVAVAAAIGADWGRWEVWLFVYLVICLTVRMAPFPGTLRGSLAATVVLGLVAAFIVSVADTDGAGLQAGWTVLSLSVATLLFLLLASLLVRGTVGLARVLAGNK
jgi:hypothetical protein